MSSCGNSHENGGESDVELNLAPVIDCFTVLITYLLVSTSFLSIEMLDVNVTVDSEQASNADQTPDVTLQVRLQDAKTFELTVTGKQPTTYRIPASKNGEINAAKLRSQLNKVKKRWPQLRDVSVSADPSVDYQDLVLVIETVKSTLPQITLGE